MSTRPAVPHLALEDLRREIQKEYADIALRPEDGARVHVGRRQARFLGCVAAEFGAQGITFTARKAA